MYFRVPILTRYKIIFSLLFLGIFAFNYDAPWENLLSIAIILSSCSVFHLYLGKGIIITRKGLCDMPFFYYPWDKIHSGRIIKQAGSGQLCIQFKCRWFPWRGTLPLVVLNPAAYEELMRSVLGDNHFLVGLLKQGMKKSSY